MKMYFEFTLMLSLGCYYHRRVQLIEICLQHSMSVCPLFYFEKGSNFIAYRFEFFKRVIESDNREILKRENFISLRL
jgi:hypothetical protein